MQRFCQSNCGTTTDVTNCCALEDVVLTVQVGDPAVETPQLCQIAASAIEDALPRAVEPSRSDLPATVCSDALCHALLCGPEDGVPDDMSDVRILYPLVLFVEVVLCGRDVTLDVAERMTLSRRPFSRSVRMLA